MKTKYCEDATGKCWMPMAEFSAFSLVAAHDILVIVHGIVCLPVRCTNIHKRKKKETHLISEITLFSAFPHLNIIPLYDE